MNKELDSIAAVLRKAFQVEVDGFTFYSMVAERADKPAVQQLFERLARDETEHQAYIKAVMRRYEDLGVGSFRFEQRDPDLEEYSSKLFTEEFKGQVQGDILETGALSIGIQLESNAVAFFSAAARDATDLQVSGFYRFLADWEGSHLRTLEKLYDSIRVDPWPEKS